MIILVVEHLDNIDANNYKLGIGQMMFFLNF
jgi:hypothetical protein